MKKKRAEQALTMTGSSIRRMRPMTEGERAVEGWPEREYPFEVLAVEYDNGAIVYAGCPICDGPGLTYALYMGERWVLEPRGELEVDGRWLTARRWLSIILLTLLLVLSVVDLVV